MVVRYCFCITIFYVALSIVSFNMGAMDVEEKKMIILFQNADELPLHLSVTKINKGDKDDLAPLWHTTLGAMKQKIEQSVHPVSKQVFLPIADYVIHVYQSHIRTDFGSATIPADMIKDGNVLNVNRYCICLCSKENLALLQTFILFKKKM
jgi:hypothetical protein